MLGSEQPVTQPTPCHIGEGVQVINSVSSDIGRQGAYTGFSSPMAPTDGEHEGQIISGWRLSFQENLSPNEFFCSIKF